jgi:hypothetical protein
MLCKVVLSPLHGHCLFGRRVGLLHVTTYTELIHYCLSVAIGVLIAMCHVFTYETTLFGAFMYFIDRRK